MGTRMPQEVAHPETMYDLVVAPQSLLRTLRRNTGAPFAGHEAGRVPMSYRGSKTATVVVAASDSIHRERQMADYRCDGTNDEVEIQAAIDALVATNGGRIVLCEGTYNLADGLTIDFQTIAGPVEIHAPGAVLNHTKTTGYAVTAQSNHDGGTYYEDRVFALLGRPRIEGNATAGGGVLLDRCQNAVVDVLVRDFADGSGVRLECDGTDPCEYNSIRIDSNGCKYGVSTNDGAGGFANTRIIDALITLPNVSGAHGLDVQGNIDRSLIQNPIIHMGQAQSNHMGAFFTASVEGLVILVPGFDLQGDTTTGKMGISFGASATGHVSLVGLQYAAPAASLFQPIDNDYAGVTVQSIGRGESIADIVRAANWQDIPTNAGWTAVTVGNGSTEQAPFYCSAIASAGGGNGTATLAAVLQGWNAGDIVRYLVDWDKKLRWRFKVVRGDVSDANFVGYVQIKDANTAAAVLAEKGIGLVVTNLGLTGESYGSGRQTVDLGTTLTVARANDIEIVLTPGEKVEFFVDGDLKGTITTASGIPSGDGAGVGYMVLSSTTTSVALVSWIGMTRPQLWQEP